MPGVRADLHERYAAWLERVAGEHAVEFDEVLAYHFEQAYRLRAGSVRWTSTAASWPTRPPSGSRRAVVVRQIEGTSLPRPTCSRVRWR